jgi:hypothetical protein
MLEALRVPDLVAEQSNQANHTNPAARKIPVELVHRLHNDIGAPIERIAAGGGCPPIGRMLIPPTRDRIQSYVRRFVQGR